MGTHADADQGKLGQPRFRFHLDGGAEGGHDRFKGGLGAAQFVGGHRKGLADITVVGSIGQNHIQVDFRFCQSAQYLGRVADLVRNAGNGDAGLVAVNGNAADDDGFHGGGFFLHDCTGVVVHGVANFKDDTEFFGEFHGTRLHHLGPVGSHFQHLVI